MIRAFNRSFPVFSPINYFASKNKFGLAQNGINSIQIIVHRSYCNLNIGIKNWIETLSEAEKEKVRLIQNEVSLNGS